MKLNNLKVEMKNIYGLEIENEEEVKSEIVNFCLSKMESFQSNSQGSKLIFEVSSYLNNNFSINTKQEIFEIKEAFLNLYKKELLFSLNPKNFKKDLEYGNKEFYFYQKSKRKHLPLGGG